MRLHADRVVLGAGSGLRVGPATVTIEGTRITGVLEEAHPSVPVDVELGKLALAPAFIDAHTHLAMTAFRGLTRAADLAGNVVEDLFFRLESALQPGDVRAFTRAAAFESLHAGVGLVWDHYYAGDEVAQGLRDAGLAGVVAPTLQDLDGPGHNDTERALEITQALATDARLADHGILAAVGPHASDTVSPELWRRASELADSLGIPIHAHLAQSDREWSRIQARHGCSPAALLEREGVLGRGRALWVHGIFLDRADLGRLDPSRHVLGYCPSSQAQFCFPARVSAWDRAGVPWLIASDCAASNDAMNPQRELRVAAALPGLAVTGGDEYERFLAGDPSSVAQVDERRAEAVAQLDATASPRALLARLWSIPGQIHPQLPAGVIESDHAAHLAVWDPSAITTWPGTDLLRTLVHADVAPALRGLMVAGRWRIPPGQDASVLDDDFRVARNEAESRRRALLERTGLSVP